MLRPRHVRRFRTPPGYHGLQLTRWPTGWYLQLGRTVWTSDRTTWAVERPPAEDGDGQPTDVTPTDVTPTDGEVTS